LKPRKGKTQNGCATTATPAHEDTDGGSMIIREDKRNYRKHSDKNLSLIGKSLDDFGAGRSILADNSGQVIGGNGTLREANKRGIPKRIIHTSGDELVVVVRDDLAPDDPRRAKLAVMDNSTTDTSEFDYLMMQEDFTIPELEDMGIDFPEDMLAIDTECPEDGETDRDAVPEAEEVPISETGKVYQLGKHRLMCGDSTSAEDVAKLMGGEKADMVFTDPPYNVAIGDKNAALNTVQPSGRCCKNIAGDAGMTDEECGKKLWLPAFQRLFENSNDCCAIYVTMPQGGTHMMMMMMMHEAGWQVKHELIWMKNSPTFSMGRLDYDYQHEPILYGWKNKHKFPGKGEFNKSVWQIDKPRKCNLHPTMKPVELVENALLNSSDPQDIILDAFSGSGTTLLACEKNDRCFRGMELDEHYCDVIRRRWAEFKYGEGCDWQSLTPEA
jgi:DNA modification methylase